MKSIIVLLFLLNTILFAQTGVVQNLKDIDFLKVPPLIDGVADFNKSGKEYFNFVEKNNDNNPMCKISYRLAYGTDFFYIFLEVESDTIIYRDRGYQNGDGLHLVFASPIPNNKVTDEFYVLAFTPLPKGKTSWQKKFIWYKNKDISFRKLRKTRFATKTMGNKTGYEILIPWSEIPPFHPWLSDKIGFNMCFVKASGKNGKTYNYIIYDEKIQSEQSSRKYTIIHFKQPSINRDYQYFTYLNKNHIRYGEKISLQIAGLSAKKKIVKLYSKILSGENTRLKISSYNVDFKKELTKKNFPIDLSGLIPGGYRFQLFESNGKLVSELPFTILPQFDSKKSMDRLSKLKGKISEGSFTTLLFKLQEINKELKRLKYYETAGILRSKLLNFNKILSFAENGKDKLKAATGIFRRAYISEIDSTLQPYSIKIPRNFQPNKKYPLLVMLHGSGQDDRNILYERNGILERFIEIAPKGRGTSNAYCINHAQDDIREAIEDVIKNYPIDTTKIILSGFSMGGYGVYRTFYEAPERFAALSIFSGHPNLANIWGIGNNQPNFLKEKYLTSFNNKKIFIFHGEEDRNCPVDLTKKLVSLLEKSGAEVTAVYEKNKGHERAGRKTMNKYFHWLENIIDCHPK